jgi:hypothetical protein
MKTKDLGPLAQVVTFISNGMSSIGGLGRIFETARTAWCSIPPPKKKSKLKSSFKKYIFWGTFDQARQCIRMFQKSDPNPQYWTSHLAM